MAHPGDGVALDTCASAVAADRVELLDEPMELFVGRVEVGADPETAARAIVVEELPLGQRPRDGVGPREVEADRPPPLRVGLGGVDREAAAPDELAEERRLPERLPPDAR